MKATAHRRQAFTVVELLVVGAIVVLLVGTLWMVLGPRAKASAEVTEAKMRLKQFALAINLYMTDHDGAPPITLEGANTGLSTRDPRSGGHLDYTLSTIGTVRNGLALAEMGFEPTVNAVVKCGGINDWKGKTQTTLVPVGHGGRKPFEVPLLELGQTLHILGARLDGSVGWFDPIEEWQTKLPQFPRPPER